jgi:hypothetical protein
MEAVVVIMDKKVYAVVNEKNEFYNDAFGLVISPNKMNVEEYAYIVGGKTVEVDIIIKELVKETGPFVVNCAGQYFHSYFGNTPTFCLDSTKARIFKGADDPNLVRLKKEGHIIEFVPVQVDG